MTSPTQTVVGNGKSNPLIAEGLLKILEGSKLPEARECGQQSDAAERLRIEEHFGF
jgi:hypothetical protein